MDMLYVYDGLRCPDIVGVRSFGFVWGSVEVFLRGDGEGVVGAIKY